MNANAIFNRFITFIYPDRCIFCGNVIFTKSELKICSSCQHNRETIGEVFAMWYYEGAHQKSIRDFKFKNRREYGDTIANLMTEDIINKEVHSGLDLIIPVPLHKSKIRQRGYNQTKILADKLGKNLEIDVDADALIRVKKTEPQMNLNKEQRADNIKDSMKVIFPDRVNGKNILLIDDILTTGSTLEECAKELKLSGAKSVGQYCVCYQPPKG